MREPGRGGSWREAGRDGHNRAAERPLTAWFKGFTQLRGEAVSKNEFAHEANTGTRVHGHWKGDDNRKKDQPSKMPHTVQKEVDAAGGIAGKRGNLAGAWGEGGIRSGNPPTGA